MDRRYLELGHRLRDARMAQGWTQRALAAVVGLSHGEIGKLEAGYRRERPAPELLDRLARALEIEAEELYLLADYPETRALPALPQYLRSSYNLPPAATAEVKEYFKHLQEKYGVTQGGREDGN